MGEIPFMRFEDVPEELVLDAVDAWHEVSRPVMLDHLMRFILAAVLPTYRKIVLAEEKPVDPMSEENFRVIDKNFGDLTERIANLEKILAQHLEIHRSIVRDGLEKDRG